MPESQLHEFGKACFEDATGKTVALPGTVNPRFDSPKTFHIKRVEFEKPIPYAGYNGRRPDVVLTNEHGHKLVVEVKNTCGKGFSYCTDMDVVGMSLVLGLDVGRWETERALRPDFSQGSPLQTVVNQTEWLIPGKPQSMEWWPYGLSLFECPNSGCGTCRLLVGGYLQHEVNETLGVTEKLRLFYGTPMLGVSGLAKHYNLSIDEVIEQVYKAMSEQPTFCGLEKEEDRKPDPGRSYREHGWVLRRNGAELPQYRIRRMPNGYQPVVYKTTLEVASPDGRYTPVDDVVANRDGNSFDVRPTWKLAVKDLFAELAPGVVPIDSLRNDQWRISSRGQ